MYFIFSYDSLSLIRNEDTLPVVYKHFEKAIEYCQQHKGECQIIPVPMDQLASINGRVEVIG